MKNLILFFRRVFQTAIAKNKISPHINPMQQFNSPASSLWVNEFNRAVAFNQITTDDAKVVKFPEKITKGGDSFGFEGSTVFLDSRNNIRTAGQNDFFKHGIGNGNYPSNGPGFATSLVDSLEDGETISKLFYSEYSLYALSSLGNLFSCGLNSFGELGLGNTTNTGQLTKINGISKVVDFSPSVHNGSGTHCLACTESGSLYAWGNNDYGQLGDGTTVPKNLPVLISSGAISGKTIVKVRAIGLASYVIDSNNDLFSCGYNGYGQLGIGTTTSVSAFTATGEKADEVFGSGSGTVQACAFVLRNGNLKATGDNSVGQLGIGDTSGTDRSSFTAITGLSEVIDLAVSGPFQAVMALKADGTVRVWGYNNQYQLGDGTTITRFSPVTPVGLPGNIVKIYQAGTSGGYANAFALTRQGQLYVTGFGGGQQGTGRFSSSQTTFTRVEHGKHKIEDFRPFYRTVLAKTNLGELLAWGWNNEFQTGTGAGADIAIPQLVRI